MTTLKPRTTTVVLFQGDDLAHIAELLEAVNSAISIDGPRRQGDGNPAQEAAKAHDAFVTEATERAETITLQALPRKQWRELQVKHAAREDNDEDELYGFNFATMGDDLVPASITEPDYAKSDEFLDSLSDGQFSRLYSAAVVLNKGGGELPKADVQQRLTQISEETSDSRARLG